MITALVCGGGNGAHVCAGLAASHNDVSARVLTLYEDEAEQWTAAMGADGLRISVRHSGSDLRTVVGKPAYVTKDPEEAMKPNVDIIVITVPSFAHEQYLTALKPYVRSGMTIVGCPGRAGFDFAVRSILGGVSKEISIMNFESLPWACRISEFGKSADVLGVKDTLAGAVQKRASGKLDPTAMFQKVLGEHPKLITRGHLLGVTLSPTNGCIHPEILYGRWKNWDGKPVQEPPLFYNGLDEETADLISRVSDEILATAKAIMEQRPGVDLNNVEHIFQWYLRTYPEDIEDKTTLYTAIRTNKAYTGLVHPCNKTEDGQYLPNFHYRYITEDLPYGLIVLKGIAEIAGVATPKMDHVIEWAQEKIGRSFIVDGKLTGSDLNITRCPQRYGFDTLDEILGISK